MSASPNQRSTQTSTIITTIDNQSENEIVNSLSRFQENRDYESAKFYRDLQHWLYPRKKTTASTQPTNRHELLTINNGTLYAPRYGEAFFAMQDTNKCLALASRSALPHHEELNLPEKNVTSRDNKTRRNSLKGEGKLVPTKKSTHRGTHIIDKRTKIPQKSAYIWRMASGTHVIFDTDNRQQVGTTNSQTLTDTLRRPHNRQGYPQKSTSGKYS